MALADDESQLGDKEPEYQVAKPSDVPRVPDHHSDDIVFTSFIVRQGCFELINSQIRKYKLSQCGVCSLDFYPLWDEFGNWITDAENQRI